MLVREAQFRMAQEGKKIELASIINDVKEEVHLTMRTLEMKILKWYQNSLRLPILSFWTEESLVLQHVSTQDSSGASQLITLPPGRY